VETIEPKTRIGVITGSSGSGKTTLLRRVLEQADRRYAVLATEFGELPIDSDVIRGTNVEITELVGGCKCCSLTGELDAAVEEILGRVHPEYVLLETPGVAEADAVVYEMEERIPRVRLDSVICIADAEAIIRFPAAQYAKRSQLRTADIVLINKIDLVTEAEIEKVVAQVREFNPNAAILKTVRCAADVSILFRLTVDDRVRNIPVRGEGTFASFAYTTATPLDEPRFRQTVSPLPPSVFRAKGFVRFHDGSCLFNYVAGRAEFEQFPAQATEVVFIGPDVERDRECIEGLFRSCEA